MIIKNTIIKMFFYYLIDALISIGILAFVGYNLLVASVDRVVYKIERSTTEFMDLLQEPG